MLFGQYLRELRRSRGLTQKELAEKAGVSFPYLSKIENHKDQPPSEEVCIRLAEALNEDKYIMIVRAGKVPTDFQKVIFHDLDAFQYLKQKSMKVAGGKSSHAD
jgi:transcriptional regulator with XRE-family HTH domain